jgi:acyl-CoA synthetase (AMP-forming)/AMP-acid ligase II
MQATAVVARNSLDYIAYVFPTGKTRRTLVGVQDARHATELEGIEVNQFLETGQHHGWYSIRHDLILEDLPAQITFTSGSEGKPKAIVLSYANLADTAARIIRAMGMTDEIREYVGVPVTYSFGMGRLRAISAIGGSAYLIRWNLPECWRRAKSMPFRSCQRSCASCWNHRRSSAQREASFAGWRSVHSTCQPARSDACANCSPMRESSSTTA